MTKLLIALMGAVLLGGCGAEEPTSLTHTEAIDLGLEKRDPWESPPATPSIEERARQYIQASLTPNETIPINSELFWEAGSVHLSTRSCTLRPAVRGKWHEYVGGNGSVVGCWTILVPGNVTLYTEAWGTYGNINYQLNAVPVANFAVRFSNPEFEQVAIATAIVAIGKTQENLSEADLARIDEAMATIALDNEAVAVKAKAEAEAARARVKAEAKAKAEAVARADGPKDRWCSEGRGVYQCTQAELDWIARGQR